MATLSPLLLLDLGLYVRVPKKNSDLGYRKTSWGWISGSKNRLLLIQNSFIIFQIVPNLSNEMCIKWTPLGMSNLHRFRFQIDFKLKRIDVNMLIAKLKCLLSQQSQDLNEI